MLIYCRAEREKRMGTGQCNIKENKQSLFSVKQNSGTVQYSTTNWWLIEPPSKVLQCIDTDVGIDIDIASLYAAG
jgi:hypothetical protein